MAVYYKTYKKIFIETGKLQGFACKMLILLILELDIILVTSQWCSYASLRIWYIQDGVQDGSW